MSGTSKKAALTYSSEKGGCLYYVYVALTGDSECFPFHKNHSVFTSGKEQMF